MDYGFRGFRESRFRTSHTWHSIMKQKTKFDIWFGGAHVHPPGPLASPQHWTARDLRGVLRLRRYVTARCGTRRSYDGTLATTARQSSEAGCKQHTVRTRTRSHWGDALHCPAGPPARVTAPEEGVRERAHAITPPPPLRGVNCLTSYSCILCSNMWAMDMDRWIEQNTKASLNPKP